MADISKINIGSTNYNIKDVVARNGNVTSLSNTPGTNEVSVKLEFYDSSAAQNTSIPAATTTLAGVMTATDKTRLDSLVASSGNGVHFVGVTSTALTDGATIATLIAQSSGSLTKTTGFISGDLVFYGNKEFIWNGTSWTLFGDLGDLGTLAFKNSASGTVTIPSTTHTHTTSIPKMSHTVTQGTVSATGTCTPKGSVGINDVGSGSTGHTLISTDTNDAYSTGNIIVLTDKDIDNSCRITPVGGTTTVNSVKSVGALPTLGTKFSVPNITNVGSLPTYSAKSIPNVTSAGTMFKASISGETLTLTAGNAPTIGDAISVNSITSAGTIPTLGVAFQIPNVTNVGSLPTYTATTVATAGSERAIRAISPRVTEVATEIMLASRFNGSFSGGSTSVSVSGTTSGISVADHNTQSITSGAASATSSASVSVS